MGNGNILSLTPEFGIEEKINFRTNITESESGLEHREALWDAPLREYSLTCRFLTQADMNTIWDFYIARQGAYDFFLVKILTEYQIANEDVGDGDNSETTFLLNNFPVDTSAEHSCTVGGSANTDYTLTNDFVNEQSNIVFNTAPVSGEILVTYEYYFKVRFAEDSLTRQLAAYQLLHTGIKMKEVRWATYTPINGNV